MADEEREPLLGHGHNNSGFIVEQDAVESDIPTINPHDPAEGAALRLGEEGGASNSLLPVTLAI